ncbi:MAG: adenine deaminase [Chloroflexi bacterium]|nr:adenine deaminase [Chloroflexota bacterium]
MSLAQQLPVASGREVASLLLLNARVINTLTGTVEAGNVAIAGSVIAGVGDYRDGVETIDLKGRYLAPGLIDGHIHIESSMLHPVEYARAVTPRGVLAVVTDLHEVANVAGLEGMRRLMAWCQGLPCDFYFMLPSCVPASPFETSGAVIKAQEMERARRWKNVVGLGEVMNFPGVVNGDPEVLAKLALFHEGVVDGHAPRLSGQALNAYVGAGIQSDHECTTLDEAREKLARGMYVMIREGSSEKNLDELLPLVDDRSYKRCMLVVDDRSCVDLLSDGDVDAVVRKAISRGLDPVRAIQLATINPAERFRLWGLGAVAPGYLANLVVFPDLRSVAPDLVIHRGRVVARDGELAVDLPAARYSGLADTVRVKTLSKECLALRFGGAAFPVIELVPGQIVTRKVMERVAARDGLVHPSVERDLLKLVVVERHRGTGNVGVGLVKGFGLKSGALASTVAHDSHNIVAVGCSDEDILSAIGEVIRTRGGLCVASGGKIIASMPLPVAGLLSDKPLRAAAAEFGRVDRAAASLGAVLKAPFATLSFLALPVIPELKLTDKGLVDVVEFKLLELE